MGPGTDGRPVPPGRLGPLAEALRSAVSRWPFRSGAHRIPRILGAGLRRLWPGGASARVGEGVLAPFAPEDFRHTAFWGLFEPGVRGILRDALRPGDAYVDLGAHRGFHLAFGLSLVGKEGLAVAAEPLPANLERLHLLAALNPDRRLVVVEAAVSRATGEADLLVGPHDMLSSIDHAPGRTGEVSRVLRVATISLDDLFDRHLRGPDAGRSVVLKVDVEGSEADALLGGPRALAERERLRTVVLECTGGSRPRARERAETVVRVLRGAGFDLRVLEKRGSLREWREEDLGRCVYLLARR